jgi:redox-sensitive bicupin YhaK (pirin superfamily)
LRGSITIARDQQANPGDLVIFSQQGESVEWQAAPGSRVLFLGGEPIDEPIVGRGPFVMNTMEEIQQAYADHRAGKFGN